MNYSHSTRWPLAAACWIAPFIASVALCATACARDEIRISGVLNNCYKFGHGVVRLSSVENGNIIPLSRFINVDNGKRFQIAVPAKGFSFGSYVLEFGDGPDGSGSGILKIKITAKRAYLGTVGDCDL
jgi:hypothetical protein